MPQSLSDALLIEAAAPIARRAPHLRAPLRVGFFGRDAGLDLLVQRFLLVDRLAQERPETRCDREYVWDRVTAVMFCDRGNEWDHDLVETICNKAC